MTSNTVYCVYGLADFCKIGRLFAVVLPWRSVEIEDVTSPVNLGKRKTQPLVLCRSNPCRVHALCLMCTKRGRKYNQIIYQSRHWRFVDAPLNRLFHNPKLSKLASRDNSFGTWPTNQFNIAPSTNSWRHFDLAWVDQSKTDHSVCSWTTANLSIAWDPRACLGWVLWVKQKQPNNINNKNTNSNHTRLDDIQNQNDNQQPVLAEKHLNATTNQSIHSAGATRKLNL